MVHLDQVVHEHHAWVVARSIVVGEGLAEHCLAFRLRGLAAGADAELEEGKGSKDVAAMHRRPEWRVEEFFEGYL